MRQGGRRERIALLVGFGIGSLAWNVCWPFLPLRVNAVLAGDPGEVARLAGLLAGGANLITAVMGPLWSQVGERFGYRLQIIRAHLGTTVSMALLGLARAPLELVGAAALLGMSGGNYPHYMALTASRTPAADLGRAVGDLQAAGQIGGTIGPVVGGLIASQLGLTAAFLASSLISVTGVLVVISCVRPDGPGSADQPPGGAPRSGSLRQAFARPEQRRLMLLLLAGDSAIQGLRPLIPIVIASRLTDPAAVATTTGLTTTLATAGTVVAALVVGRISRRVEPRLILLATLPLSVLLVAAVPLASELWLLIALWALTGMTIGAVTPAIFAWLGRLGAQGGGGFALLASTNMLGFALGPMVMGQASVYGLDAPFRLAAVLTLVGWILVATSRLRPAAPAAA